jgi:hypothetical protein
MTSVVSKLTYDEFQTLPRDGSKRLELIEGEVFMTPSPNTKHQMAAANLHLALGHFVREAISAAFSLHPTTSFSASGPLSSPTCSSSEGSGFRSSRTPTSRARRTS